MKIKLQKITTSDSQNVFHISVQKEDADRPKHITFLTDTESSDDFQPVNGNSLTKYNKNSLYDKNSVIYNNMYDSTTPYYKSYFYKKPKTQRTGTSNDFQDIYDHCISNQILGSTQIQNYVYMLEAKTADGHLALSSDIICWLSSDNGMITPDTHKIDTDIYDKDKLIENIKNNILSDDAIRIKLNNVKYNMIHELPGNIYNDYESRTIVSHTFKGKNQYDCEYSMCHDDEKILTYIRSYVGIDKCNNQLYLKYNDKDYVQSQTSEQSSADSKNKYGIYLPNIEIIKRINRENCNNNHSTTLYSININVRKLFQNIKLPNEEQNTEKLNTVKENIKLEIRNCVRSIAESIQPANTQLYHVYVNGE